MRYDAIVLGLGGMGSAVAAHAAAAGLRVLGLERFHPVHAFGSSHGGSRIIRQAYFESPDYVPLLRRAYELWAALEKRTGMELVLRTGGLFAGLPDAEIVAGTIASAKLYGLAHEILDADAIRARWPLLHPRPGEIGVFEAIAGIVFPERAVGAHVQVAQAEGAKLRFVTAVAGWEAEPDGIAVTLTGGEVVRARRLAICAGAWFDRLAGETGIPTRVERNVQVYFEAADREAVGPEHLPIYALERPELANMIYGFPDVGEGAKAAFHHTGEIADPDAFDRSDRAADVENVRAALADWLPAVAEGSLLRTAPCMYTITPDTNFVIGPHPRNPDVILAGGFSGHGYKFAPVVGEIVAALLAGRESPWPIGLFNPDRFAKAHAS